MNCTRSATTSTTLRFWPSFDEDGAALVEILTARLGLLAPHHHGEEARLVAFFPALRGVVPVHRQSQIGDRGAARRIPKLRRAGQIPDEEDLVQARHQTTSSVAAGCCFGADRTRLRTGMRVVRKRNTCSFNPSCRSNSFIVVGVEELSMTA